jgi:tetratricopeptide (TPR) repeat protein
MRGILSALAFWISVSLTALAQQTVVIAPEAQSSRAQSAATYLDRGNGWLKQGEFERAISDYSLAIAFDPGYAGAYFNRGLAQVDKGELDGALRDFDRALALNPRMVKALIGRGLARCRKGEFVGGLADFNRAIELNPRDSSAWILERRMVRGDNFLNLHPFHPALKFRTIDRISISEWIAGSRVIGKCLDQLLRRP